MHEGPRKKHLNTFFNGLEDPQVFITGCVETEQRILVEHCVFNNQIVK